MKDLSIIIPNFNGKLFLKECLESLLYQKTSFDVIIVDNGSTDGSSEFVKENYPHYTLIENQTNLGFSNAVNQGIKASQTEYVFLLNNDTKLELTAYPISWSASEKMMISSLSHRKWSGLMIRVYWMMLGMNTPSWAGPKKGVTVNSPICIKMKEKFSVPVPGQRSIGKAYFRI